jgi:DNA-binding MarR family transcriptional regulator
MSAIGEHHLTSSDIPCACTALRKAARAVTRLYEGRMGDAGLTIAQFAILRALDREPDQPLSRLADAMVMDRTSLYRALTPMVREGWLVIGAGRGARAKITSLTGEGREVMARAAPRWAAAQAGFLDTVGRDAWLAAAGTLKAIVDVAAKG